MKESDEESTLGRFLASSMAILTGIIHRLHPSPGLEWFLND